MGVPQIRVKIKLHAFLVLQAFIVNVLVDGRELHVEYVIFFVDHLPSSLYIDF
jgi:hypothetical protein